MTETATPHLPEIPNLITLVAPHLPHRIGHFLHTWEDPIFAFTIVAGVGLLVAIAARKLALVPGRGQALAETVVEGMDQMICGILGKEEGRRYLPFVGTLFVFILSMNLAGLVPGLKSPTSKITMTGALAFCVFCYVQWTGIRRRGIGGYLLHLMGEPQGLFGWLFAPIMFFVEVIGAVVKPVSLAARLFGNIMAEDILLGVFVMLGTLFLAWSHLPVGIPLHLPIIPLVLIFSLVQALVFTLLSTVYIAIVLPHEG